MKTSEVIKELEKMGLRTEMRENDLYVIACETKDIASINLKRKFKVDTNFFNFTNKLTEDEQEKVYVMLTKLAETEPEDRGEEKKYYLRHKWLGEDDSNYLNLVNNYAFEICTKKEVDKYKTQFTAEEIKAIKRKFNTDLEDFEIVEVEE